MAVPYTFGSATSAIPLSQLDSNFATTITLGNTAIQLGNTVTTLNNMTLANVTVSSVASAITVPQGGTGQTTLTTAYGVLCAGTTATGAVQTLSSLGTSGQVLTSNGAAALPTWQTPGAAALTYYTASLGADVSLTNTATYFDGPSVAQGTSGTWFVSGTVTVKDSSPAEVIAKLWDGTTVIASGGVYMTTGNGEGLIALSGVITSPAGNLRISCRDPVNTTGLIKYNQTGNSKDSTITAIRIA